MKMIFRNFIVTFISSILLVSQANAEAPLIPAPPQLAASAYILLDAKSG